MKWLGLGAAALVVEPVVEPVRRFWQVGLGAPVPNVRVATPEETLALGNTETLLGIDAGAYSEWRAATVNADTLNALFKQLYAEGAVELLPSASSFRSLGYTPSA